MMLLAVVAMCANAGTWKLHDYFVTANIQNIFDTSDKVYYVNSNRLFVFDKATTTTQSYSSQNYLSDDLVDQIYYDCDKQLLFVAYTNSNIDVIDANGKVTNISSLKDATMHVYDYSVSSGVVSSYSGKEINDITFTDGLAYVATGFGYLIIDESTLKVTKTYNLDTSINSAARVGDLMVLLTASKCYYGSPDSSSPLSEYASTSGTFTNAKMFPFGDSKVFVIANTIYMYDFSSGTPAVTTVYTTGHQVASIQSTPTGFIVNYAVARFSVTIDSTGTTMNGSMSGLASSNPDGDGTIWLLDGNGLHIRYSTTYYNGNVITTDEPYWLKYNAAMGKLYVGNTGPNSRTTEAQNNANIINTYDGTTWANATAFAAQGSGYEFSINPLEPTTYVRASWSSGVKKVTNDKLVMTYTSSNSPITTYKPSPIFDKYGNLWVVSSYGKSASPAVVLPAAKVANTSVSTSDWFIPSGLLDLNTGTMKRSRFVISNKNNYKVYTDCDLNDSESGQIFVWDNGNEDPTVDTYKLANITSFVDQNNQSIAWTYLTHLEADKDGNIWVGHTSGLFMFDPDGAFDVTPKATRPYVSNFSEGQGYLVDGYTVYDIGVDRNNNKWIATSDNGLYYVSADGTEVYNHFTTSNSDIPSDVVYSVECDTVNDRVYVYTLGGFAEYIADGDAAALNFDDVYAFPNPVEPDFTGLIKIRGLMENSYVTITDRDGTVVAQLGPVMGSALWDGSDSTGERLPTGIYNIYAAQGAQPDVTGTPQARVMIIK